MEAGKIEELESTLDGNLALLTIVSIHAIPFVNRHHQRTARFFNETRQMRILVGNVLLRIQHEDHHVGGFNGL